MRAGEEAVVLDFDRLTGRPPFLSGHRQLPDLFLLLRVHADHRLARGLVFLDLLVDIAELRVPVRVLIAFQGLGSAPQAEPVFLEQSAHRGRGHAMPLPGQLVGQVPQ